MNRFLLGYLLLLSPLVARENPFLPPSGAKNDTVSTNVPDARPPLGNVAYTLPDQSRVIKQITLTVQNLDGSIETQQIEVDRTIDWHRPLIITQGSSDVTVATTRNSRSDATIGPISVHTEGKRLSITSPYPLIRHFSLSQPNRIVFDFKHDKEFSTVEKTLNAAPFQTLTVGTHGKFTRATVTLDGRYRYTAKQSGKTVTVICK